MADLLMMALLGIAFVGALGYVHACLRVLQPDKSMQGKGQ
jgi:preprotein translocase subunit Sss1